MTNFYKLMNVIMLNSANMFVNYAPFKFVSTTFLVVVMAKFLKWLLRVK